MKNKYDLPYHTWQEIPIQVQNIFFDEFNVNHMQIAQKKANKRHTLFHILVAIILVYFLEKILLE